MDGRRLKDDRSGAALVEFALVAPLFLMVLIAILQLGVLGMMSANFNAAMDSVSRRIRTGQVDKPHDAGEFRALICARMVDTAANCNARMKVTVQPMGTSFANAQAAVQGQNAANITGQQAFDAGGPDEVMLVTATYAWPVALPFVGNAFIRNGVWEVLIVSRLAFKNEPFDD